MAVVLSLGVSACSGSEDASDAAVDAAQADPAETSGENGALAGTPTLADGPDVCFKAITKHLGADTKVSEITSFFSTGSEIDSSDSRPQGQMTICTVEYQSPDDPRKLVSTRLDLASGEFSPPQPIEITVMGNAAEFNLEDYLVPLSQINASGLASVMEAQKSKLGDVYSRYAWLGVRLSAPDAFNDKHTLRLDVEGRLASNDIKESGYASVSLDGRTITADHLTP
ncbi:hypothetical protein [Pelagerythrobacter aerophilus]|uniref:Uncharacterized protein n=1 Tax=Pelagerythrobacter aerophilus TaxID=2306995 RepID=A0A418NH66_9SPHN|nr:hypothetical protein [Pelagerythrobacter aerophilus]RIV77947.1 hypothetical protein D2V04_08575 [Pelagerythrobacter aerophilus]